MGMPGMTVFCSRESWFHLLLFRFFGKSEDKHLSLGKLARVSPNTCILQSPGDASCHPGQTRTPSFPKLDPVSGLDTESSYSEAAKILD